MKVEILEDLSLYDSDMLNISLYRDDNNIVNAEVVLSLCYPKGAFLKFIFKDLIEYSLYWNDNYNFYTIDTYKLLKIEDSLYYCSLDPCDEMNVVSEDDGDIIKCKDIEAYYSYDINFKENKKIKFSISL